MVETVDDLLQPCLRHRVFGILGNLSEDVAAQFGEVLGQLAPLLLGEVVGKLQSSQKPRCRCLQRGFLFVLSYICHTSAEFSKTSRPRS